jgi:hypothetical protein
MASVLKEQELTRDFLAGIGSRKLEYGEAVFRG